ncbi:MAG: HD domain-containing phosphohydrolase [Alphaproteobacteria bacterium]|nr:HD domain-containing phosphohydrolase [Alphaproteobacteria bacterium]
MTQTHGNNPKLKQPSLNPRILALLVVVMAVLGGALVSRFVAVERARELLSWQNRLSLIADSRASDIEAWLDRHFKELGDVASNPSLQLYMAELQSDSKSAAAEDPAQAVYLRNLLSITADRLGFTEKISAELKSINADVRQPAGVGLAIVDNKGKILVATAGLPALGDELAAKIERLPLNQPSLIDIFTTQSGSRHIGFALPIYPIDADPNAAQPIGRLVGVKNVGGDLFKLLRQPGATEQTLAGVLLRKEGDNAAYLSPQGGEKDTAASLSLNTPDLDASYALTSPGNFAVKKDAQSRSVLMTSRAIAHSPWVMLLHIDRNEALRDSDTWVRQIQYSLLFALLAVIGAVVAIWYYGTSRRSLLLALETKRMAAKSVAQEQLLRVVADNQLEPIVIADKTNIARFANAKAAQAFHMPTGDIAGKDLAALMGSEFAKGYSEANNVALLRNAPYIRTWSMENGTKSCVIRSAHVPLAHIPVEGLPAPSPGVLMIDQDITEIVNEREHRMRILRQLVDMLVHMVDSRDPNAASHSACVAFVARAVAVGIGLDSERVETTEIAGKLMNIGKILVPSDVLTKADSLTEKEMRGIHDAMSGSIALLEKIEFDGPVVDTLRQSRECFNGSGPLGLRGENILVTARIIAVANAFIGMISPRSYRDALGIEQAIKTLIGAIDIQFDRRVVVALADFVENQHGRDSLAQLIAKGNGG